MKLIAGLGNPGREYENTPHNIGFDVVDELSSRLSADWRNSSKFHALTAKAEVNGETVWLVKPLTYMNLSGNAIAPLLHYYQGTPADLITVEDDCDLPFGKLRVRGGGTSGGHHGLDSVIAQLGTDRFARVRVSMGRTGEGSLIGHVLGRYDAERLAQVGTVVKASADAALCWTENGLNETMNRFNSWSLEPPAAAPAAV